MGLCGKLSWPHVGIYIFIQIFAALMGNLACAGCLCPHMSYVALLRAGSKDLLVGYAVCLHCYATCSASIVVPSGLARADLGPSHSHHMDMALQLHQLSSAYWSVQED